MRICILTQTAHDLSDYYKSFFQNTDIYFVTFKTPNKNAVDFLPNSSWSDGRNRLWNEVRGKYDYYLFIDDDLEFFCAKFKRYPLIQYCYQKLNKNVLKSYHKCSFKVFFSQLRLAIENYSPEVLSVKNLNNLNNNSLDYLTLKKGDNARIMGWFDAQFTLFSDYAANRLLPYDTSISGWASAQILIYLISYNVFSSKAISLINLGVNNSYHTGAYIPDYKSNIDCQNMIKLICKHINIDYNTLFDKNSNHVNLYYGKEDILKRNIKNKEEENYKINFETSVKGIEQMMINNNLNF
jgi:hypothetical protein